MNPQQNSRKSNDAKVKLQKPGAGLPFLEGLVAKYFIMPVKSRQMSWDESDQLFLRETDKILKLVSKLDTAALETQVLIGHIAGIEDSSRFWSPAMTMEHLMIVAPHLSSIIVELSHGRVPHVVVDVAAVKPKSAIPASDVARLFEGTMKDVHERIKTEVGDRGSSARLHHPWFGKITAHQWH
ncbi:MAG: hypothetical protein HY074_20240 [Deltaproteobacteria bacterium]|nr:hypothetical protein [Deltaproteobacteria bacterium]